MDDTGTLNHADTPNIGIEIEKGISNDELNDLIGEDDGSSSGIQQHLNQNNHENTNDHDDSERTTELILSKYSGETSSIDYFATQNQNDQNNDPVTATTEEQLQESIDMDNYVSPCPGTSSSQAKTPSLLGNNSTGRRNVSGPGDSMNGSSISKQQPRNKSNDTLSMPPNNLPAPKATIPVKAAVGQGQARMSERTVPSNRAAAIIAPASHHSASRDEMTSAAAKEKRIEAIRQRMESCLTAINNKVTEKGQRSPYAPFLAYLGTKLPHVQADILPVLEKEILELVDRYSQ